MGADELDVGLLTSELLDGVFACSKSGEIMFSNPAFARMLGFKHETMKAKNIAKDIVERDLEWRALVSLLEQGSPIHDYEIKFRRSDGMVMIISLTANALLDENGSPIGIAAVARDISTRKGVENELREKAFRIDIMNRIAKLAGTHKDIRTVLLKVSEELQKLLDFDSICAGVTEEKGRHVEVFVPDPKHADKAVSLGKVLYEGSIVEKLRFGGKAVIVEKEAGRKLFSEFGVLDVNKASSMMAVPLTSRGRVLGSLNLLDSKQAEYDWESAEALQMVADLLAGMIDNMVLFATLETKMSLQEALVTVQRRAAEGHQHGADLRGHLIAHHGGRALQGPLVLRDRLAEEARAARVRCRRIFGRDTRRPWRVRRGHSRARREDGKGGVRGRRRRRPEVGGHTRGPARTQLHARDTPHGFRRRS